MSGVSIVKPCAGSGTSAVSVPSISRQCIAVRISSVVGASIVTVAPLLNFSVAMPSTSASVPVPSFEFTAVGKSEPAHLQLSACTSVATGRWKSVPLPKAQRAHRERHASRRGRRPHRHRPAPHDLLLRDRLFVEQLDQRLALRPQRRVQPHLIDVCRAQLRVADHVRLQRIVLLGRKQPVERALDAVVVGSEFFMACAGARAGGSRIH